MLVRNIQARTITVDSDLRSRIVQAVDRALVVDTLPPLSKKEGMHGQEGCRGSGLWLGSGCECQ